MTQARHDGTRQREIGVDPEGHIYEAIIGKDGKPLYRGRINRTNQCISAVMQHMAATLNYISKGLAGYQWVNPRDGRDVQLILMDIDRYKVVSIKQFEELKRKSQSNSFENRKTNSNQGEQDGSKI